VTTDGFADPGPRYTRQFERYALDLSRFMATKDVAPHPNVSGDVVKDIQKRYLARRFGRPKSRILNESPLMRFMAHLTKAHLFFQHQVRISRMSRFFYHKALSI
jgi:hypothetical protein